MATRGKIATAVAWAGRVTLAAVYGWAGLAKALDPGELARAIDRYQLLPYPMAAALALLLPWVEIVGAVAVVSPKLRCGGLALLGACSLLFVGATTSGIVRGLDIACGCFGGESGAGALPLAALRAGLLFLLCCVRMGWAARQRAAATVPVRHSFGRSRGRRGALELARNH
jgi:uncharacterized membrane protein YphA (DoxX/SURF4 family)